MSFVMRYLGSQLCYFKNVNKFCVATVSTKRNITIFLYLTQFSAHIYLLSNIHLQFVSDVGKIHGHEFAFLMNNATKLLSPIFILICGVLSDVFDFFGNC